MILNPKEVASNRWIVDNQGMILSKDKRVQPNGIDLTLAKVYRMEGTATVECDSKSLPQYTPMKSYQNLDKKRVVKLLPGNAYILQIEETITIPANIVGLTWMRSTFNRCGCPIFACVFDSGYKGIPTFAAYPTLPIWIELGTRIAQILYFNAVGEGLYAGQYQGQGLTKKEFVEKLDGAMSDMDEGLTTEKIVAIATGKDEEGTVDGNN